MMIARILLSVVMLVAATVAAAQYAVVTVPVANLREEPRHGAEMLSQGILGTPLIVVSHTGEWLQVEMPDGYRGYMIANSVRQMNTREFDAWRTSRRVKVLPENVKLLSSVEADADVVSTLQTGDVLAVDSIGAECFKVSLPDGRSGYVASDVIEEFARFDSAADEASAVADKIIDNGRAVIGQEYLWGGTSIKAADCSGLTRILFFAEGIYLPRDAYQQAEIGKAVTYSELRKGDLIFFTNAKGRVNHVGIYEGDGVMLHCSGCVREDRIGESQFRSHLPAYYKKPTYYRRVIGVDIPSNEKANQLYFK